METFLQRSETMSNKDWLPKKVFFQRYLNPTELRSEHTESEIKRETLSNEKFENGIMVPIQELQIRSNMFMASR